MFLSYCKAPILNMNSMLNTIALGLKNIVYVPFITRITVAKGSHLILPHLVRFSKAIFALTLD